MRARIAENCRSVVMTKGSGPEFRNSTVSGCGRGRKGLVFTAFAVWECAERANGTNERYVLQKRSREFTHP